MHNNSDWHILDAKFNERNNATFIIRSMFYLLKPSETYYKTVHEIPNVVEKVIIINVLYMH